jgi:hypothetical protein
MGNNDPLMTYARVMLLVLAGALIAEPRSHAAASRLGAGERRGPRG